MKRSSLALGLLASLFIFQGCAVVGGIFKAGVWVGVIGVAIIVGIIIFVISKSSNK